MPTGSAGPFREAYFLLLHLLACSLSRNASLKAPITTTPVQMVIIALMRWLPGEDACLFFWRAKWERSGSDSLLQQPLAGLLDLPEGPRLRRLTANGCQ